MPGKNGEGPPRVVEAEETSQGPDQKGERDPRTLGALICWVLCAAHGATPPGGGGFAKEAIPLIGFLPKKNKAPFAPSKKKERNYSKKPFVESIFKKPFTKETIHMEKRSHRFDSRLFWPILVPWVQYVTSRFEAFLSLRQLRLGLGDWMWNLLGPGPFGGHMKWVCPFLWAPLGLLERKTNTGH